MEGRHHTRASCATSVLSFINALQNEWALFHSETLQNFWQAFKEEWKLIVSEINLILKYIITIPDGIMVRHPTTLVHTVYVEGVTVCIPQKV